MEEGKLNLTLESIDLFEVMENVIRKVEFKVKAKGLGVHVDMDKKLPLLYGDGLRMEQIFRNLIDNAIQYMENGEILIQLKRVDKHTVMVVIQDTGIGIAEEDLPYIFERFYRAEKSRSRDHGGTGLGLAIVKHLVELQGGSIQVSSHVGEGTRFEIFFPISNSLQS